MDPEVVVVVVVWDGVLAVYFNDGDGKETGVDAGVAHALTYCGWRVCLQSSGAVAKGPILVPKVAAFLV
ncbi:hypothetical protein E2C01_052315 [Portunus trituberculatus]|uniref:Uncharacterized protein n=1 Tax=Portunus trituberculatus TaxID=210409 RepID=A0A5B7GM53_PORTR|nr:hypothetical protein [Portunus trituberculatus]